LRQKREKQENRKDLINGIKRQIEPPDDDLVTKRRKNHVGPVWILMTKVIRVRT